MSDPYLDPSSGVLRNKLGFTDQESLDRAESDSVVVRGTLLDLNPPKGNFDAQHLKAIHEYFFAMFTSGPDSSEPSHSPRPITIAAGESQDSHLRNRLRVN